MNYRLLSIVAISGILLTSAAIDDVISFEFNGTVSAVDEPLQDVEIRIFEGNEVLSTIYSDKKGRFDFELMKGGEFTLELSKAGYIPKRMIMRTNVEDGVKKLPKLKFEVALIEQGKYADVMENDPKAAGILDFPSAIIEYNKAIGDFDYRMEYTNHILKEVEDIE